MNIPVKRIVTGSLFGIVALALAVIALLVLPVYGALMVVWMHIPLVYILVTVGPLAAIFGIGAYASARASGRACKVGT